MTTAFILLFQEHCESMGATVETATKTLTAISAEQIDSDPDRAWSPRLFQRRAPLAGTRTLTKANAEGADEDPQQRILRALAIDNDRLRAGTRTTTFIAGEAPDADPQVNRREFLSECLLF